MYVHIIYRVGCVYPVRVVCNVYVYMVKQRVYLPSMVSCTGRVLRGRRDWKICVRAVLRLRTLVLTGLLHFKNDSTMYNQSGTEWVRLVHNMHNVKSQMALRCVPCALLRVLVHTEDTFLHFFSGTYKGEYTTAHKMYDFSTRESDDVLVLCVWGRKKNAGRCVSVPAAVHNIPAAIHKVSRYRVCRYSTHYLYTVDTNSANLHRVQISNPWLPNLAFPLCAKACAGTTAWGRPPALWRRRHRHGGRRQGIPRRQQVSVVFHSGCQLRIAHHVCIAREAHSLALLAQMLTVCACFAERAGKQARGAHVRSSKGKGGSKAGSRTSLRKEKPPQASSSDAAHDEDSSDEDNEGSDDDEESEEEDSSVDDDDEDAVFALEASEEEGDDEDDGGRRVRKPSLADLASQYPLGKSLPPCAHTWPVMLLTEQCRWGIRTEENATSRQGGVQAHRWLIVYN
jgi:hypothetical protein